MSEAQWFEIDEDVGAATRHFARSIDLFGAGGTDPGDPAHETLERYRDKMALMHAMQAGHTSLESALVRVLRILGEELPSGEGWHADLIRRCARPVDKRPAIISEAVANAADATRRFRHVATRSDDTFEMERARHAILAAGMLVRAFAPAIEAFKSVIDPPASA